MVVVAQPQYEQQAVVYNSIVVTKLSQNWNIDHITITDRINNVIFVKWQFRLKNGNIGAFKILAPYKRNQSN